MVCWVVKVTIILTLYRCVTNHTLTSAVVINIIGVQHLLGLNIFDHVPICFIPYGYVVLWKVGTLSLVDDYLRYSIYLEVLEYGTLPSVFWCIIYCDKYILKVFSFRHSFISNHQQTRPWFSSHLPNWGPPVFLLSLLLLWHKILT